MTINDITNLRLLHQQVSATKFTSAKDLVSWMGAMQAQDYPMVKWALGIRLPGTTDASIEAAINKGEALRIHVLRPTWHLVSPENIRWMLMLSGAHIIASMKTRDAQMGLNEKIYEKSNAAIVKALSGGKQLTRDELAEKLENTGIDTGDYKIAHMLTKAEADALICSGTMKGRNNTYILLDERVPKSKTLSRTEALAKLAQIYFTSHGPATLQDFVWWSGLTVKEAREGLENTQKKLGSATIEGQTYWFLDAALSRQTKATAFLLPAFDEFIISYRDRSATLSAEVNSKAVFSNGVFRPVVVVNGQTGGIWNREKKKDSLLITVNMFKTPDKKTKELIDQAAVPYGTFMDKKIEIKYGK